MWGLHGQKSNLFITNAQMRTLFGRTNMNPVSRFISEIPEELLEGMEPATKKSDYHLLQELHCFRKAHRDSQQSQQKPL